jgi:hypothetical protein
LQTAQADAWASDSEAQRLAPRGLGQQQHQLPPAAVAAMPPPLPVLASAGQLSIMSYAAVHSASAVASAGTARKMWQMQFADAELFAAGARGPAAAGRGTGRNR